MNFPASRSDCIALANYLVDHLRKSFGETSTRPDWTSRNLEALETFAKQEQLASFYSPKLGGSGEFLWDWTAFVPGGGLLIASESEWDRDVRNNHGRLKDDAAKLLFAFAPIKLFLCWVKEESGARTVSEAFHAHFCEDYSVFQPGSVFILYCIHAETISTQNKDSVFLFQAGGEFASEKQRFKLERIDI